ncbi:MAG: hypothetical protein M1829_003699 [Trizodia sp. TS-e1964]|nr:MAG: hypothetical protein M1829_003699 [Trizodia sp. TS-e1964]
MDDLSGLDWSSDLARNQAKPPPMNPATYYPSLRPTPPLSGRSTPVLGQVSGSSSAVKSAARSPTPLAADSFSSLVSFGSSKATNNLSLQEQHQKLQDERIRKESEMKKFQDTQFGTHHGDFWDMLGGQNPSRSQNIARSPIIPYRFAGSQNLASEDTGDVDLLSAFSAAAPVDSSTFFPPPSATSEPHRLSYRRPEKSPFAPQSLSRTQPESSSILTAEEDDPFGLKNITRKPAPTLTRDNNEDILGDLGKPVSMFEQQKHSLITKDISTITSSSKINPGDIALSEIVDMGFPEPKAKQALSQTESGIDVPGAITWLLNEAHKESKMGSIPSSASPATESVSKNASQHIDIEGHRKNGDPLPNWMKNNERSQKSASNGEKDISKYASDVSNNLLKTANTLWSTSRRRVQKAVSDFQQDSGQNQPKWMKESRAEPRTRSAQSQNFQGVTKDTKDEVRYTEETTLPDIQQPSKSKKIDQNDLITDEALMLESRGPRRRSPQPRSRETEMGLNSHRFGASRDHSPIPTERLNSLRQPINSQQPFRDCRSALKLSRQAVEDQSSQAYISPARRRKPTPTPSETDKDLLRGSHIDSNPFKTKASPVLSSNNIQNHPPKPPHSTTPLGSNATTRRIPPATNSALENSASLRRKGTEQFKLGDFAAAHISYSRALSPLPDTHPVTIIVLCNRALVNLKTGDAKSAIADAEAALSTIGPSKGEGEIIRLGGSEGDKDMRDFFGKALMRKAEGLEQLEKWSEALLVWREAVEAGIGGATCIQGRGRCEKAIGGGSNTSKPTLSPSTRRLAAASSYRAKPLDAINAQSAEAVQRLRAANSLAERTDDEKFALSDSVDARLNMWKGGKEDNLRALLASLDTVLWPEAGWVGVSMAQLIVVGKVKVHYMKGIAKVHPDKIPVSATTEQRMISGAVFSVLNEAWEKFKRENGL